jgi:glutathione-regulated potassium-efflux system ancillary protein KefC
LHLCDDVRAHFPHLTIVARARNVTHYLELRERGIALVERETFEAALSSGRAALEALGVDRYEARERADRFRRHNLRALEQALPHYKDETSRLSSAKAARQELDEQFQRDVAALERQGKAGWHEELEAAGDERASRLPG